MRGSLSFAGNPSNQSGPRQRRSRTAAATNNAAKTSPNHRPGELRYLPGVSSGQSIECMLKAKALGANPITRSFKIEAKCEVPNVIFSKNPIARNGTTAQRNVTRRDQPDTSSAHP